MESLCCSWMVFICCSWAVLSSWISSKCLKRFSSICWTHDRRSPSPSSRIFSMAFSFLSSSCFNIDSSSWMPCWLFWCWVMSDWQRSSFSSRTRSFSSCSSLKRERYCSSASRRSLWWSSLASPSLIFNRVSISASFSFLNSSSRISMSSSMSFNASVFPRESSFNSFCFSVSKIISASCNCFVISSVTFTISVSCNFTLLSKCSLSARNLIISPSCLSSSSWTFCLVSAEANAASCSCRLRVSISWRAKFKLSVSWDSWSLCNSFSLSISFWLCNSFCLMASLSVCSWETRSFWNLMFSLHLIRSDSNLVSFSRKTLTSLSSGSPLISSLDERWWMLPSEALRSIRVFSDVDFNEPEDNSFTLVCRTVIMLSFSSKSLRKFSSRWALACCSRPHCSFSSDILRKLLSWESAKIVLTFSFSRSSSW